MRDSGQNGRAMSISLRHLKLFESVARLSSVRRASEECFLSQPAVTQAITKLEQEVGTVLLERRASGSYLNDSGLIFYRRIKRLFSQIESALEELGAPGAQTPVSVIASRITRSQIRSLEAIVENGSFVQAARALNVAPASLHRSARDIERNLRKPLYHRTAFGIMATPAAVEFARKIKLAIQELDAALEELQASNGHFGSQIVIGALPMSGSAMMASVVEEFISAYPDAQIRVLNSNADEMHKSLQSGAVDFVVGLLRDSPPADLVNEPLVQTPYVVAARHGHPLAGRPKVALEDLAGYDWVIGTPGANRRRRFDALFSGPRKPRAQMETCSLANIRLLLAKSNRLTLLTSYELTYETEVLTAVPFGPITPAPWMGVTMRADWLPTPLQARFLDYLRERLMGSLTPAEPLRKAS